MKLKYAIPFVIIMLILSFLFWMQDFTIAFLKEDKIQSEVDIDFEINQSLLDCPYRIIIDEGSPLLRYALKGYCGVYILNSVFIFSSEICKKQLDTSIYHEIGHCVWDKINESIRDDYTMVYETSRCSPTVYGKTNVKEDFAESFECYFTGRCAELSQQRIELIKKSLGGYYGNNPNIR